MAPRLLPRIMNKKEREESQKWFEEWVGNSSKKGTSQVSAGANSSGVNIGSLNSQDSLGLGTLNSLDSSLPMSIGTPNTQDSWTHNAAEEPQTVEATTSQLQDAGREWPDRQPDDSQWPRSQGFVPTEQDSDYVHGWVSKEDMAPARVVVLRAPSAPQQNPVFWQQRMGEGSMGSTPESNVWAQAMNGNGIPEWALEMANESEKAYQEEKAFEQTAYEWARELEEEAELDAWAQEVEDEYKTQEWGYAWAAEVSVQEQAAKWSSGCGRKLHVSTTDLPPPPLPLLLKSSLVHATAAGQPSTSVPPPPPPPQKQWAPPPRPLLLKSSLVHATASGQPSTSVPPPPPLPQKQWAPMNRMAAGQPSYSAPPPPPPLTPQWLSPTSQMAAPFPHAPWNCVAVQAPMEVRSAGISSGGASGRGGGTPKPDYDNWTLKTVMPGGSLPQGLDDILGLAASYPAPPWNLYQHKSQKNELEGRAGKVYGVQLWIPSGKAVVSIFFDSYRVTIGGAHPERAVQYIDAWAEPQNESVRRPRKAKFPKGSRGMSPDSARDDFVKRRGLTFPQQTQ